MGNTGKGIEALLSEQHIAIGARWNTHSAGLGIG